MGGVLVWATDIFVDTPVYLSNSEPYSGLLKKEKNDGHYVEFPLSQSMLSL